MVTPTDNHELDKYDLGEQDWSHADDMETIEKRLTIRDTEANRSNYTPHDGAEFIATDSGAVYDGDGTNWVKADREVGSLATDGLTHGSAEDVPQSIASNVTDGRVVGNAGQAAAKSVAFSDFATDDAAIQAVNDWLVNNGGGDIHIPHERGDGTAVTIESTVVFGESSSRVEVNAHFHGGTDKGGSRIETTISDGSEVFLITGNTDTNNAVIKPTLRGLRLALGGDVDGIRAIRALGVSITDVVLEGVERSGIVLDDSTWGFLVDDVFMRGNDTSNAVGIELTGDTGNGEIGGGVAMEQNFSECVTDSGANSNVRISGHYESAHGVAALSFTEGSRVAVTPSTEITSTSNGAHGIYADNSGGGTELYAAPHKVSGTSGDGIRFDSGNRVYISPYISMGGVSGEDITVTTEPGGTGIVPYEASVEGSVSYPGGAWTTLFYPDGWQLQGEGTTTVSSGGTTVALDFAGLPARERRVVWWYDSDPGADAEVDEVRQFDTSRGQEKLLFSESLGNTDVDVAWRVLQVK